MGLSQDTKTALGRAVFLPCAIMAAAGIVMGAGYALCPQAMQGGSITLLSQKAGLFLVRIAGALTDNAGFFFAASFSAAFAKRDRAEGALYGIGVWLAVTAVTSFYLFDVLFPSLPLTELSFRYLPSPFAGVLSGLVGAYVYRRAKSFSSGIVLLLAASAVLSAVLSVFWLIVFPVTVSLGTLLAEGGTVSAAAYACLNRLLMPLNLHHGLNQAVLFHEGAGDLARYWAGSTEGDPGRFMCGFFAPMIFGVPAAALSLYRTKRGNNELQLFLILAAVSSFICGFSEPLEFFLLSASPLLYLLYCLLYGIFTVPAVLSGFRAGFALSGGLCDLFFSAACPAAKNTWVILPLGVCVFAVFYVVSMYLLKNQK